MNEEFIVISSGQKYREIVLQTPGIKGKIKSVTVHQEMCGGKWATRKTHKAYNKK